MTLSTSYPKVTYLLATGFTYTSATIKCALLTESYVPTAAGTEQYWSDVSTYEVAGAGYTAGGVTVTSKAATYNATTRTTILSAANPSWASLTATFRYAIYYVSTGTPSTSSLLAYVDFETARTANAQPVRVIVPATGVTTLQVN